MLTIGRPIDGTSGIHTVPIKLMASGMTCSHRAVTYDDDGIRAFFAAMAADWRGWAGTRACATLEEDLAIAATHTGRRVELAITMQQRAANEHAWRVSLTISLLPDATLDRLACDIDELFGDL